MAKKTLSQSSQPRPTEVTKKSSGSEWRDPSIQLSKYELDELHDCMCGISEISWLGAHSSLDSTCSTALGIISGKMLEIMEDVEKRNPGFLNRNHD